MNKNPQIQSITRDAKELGYSNRFERIDTHPPVYTTANILNINLAHSVTDIETAYNALRQQLVMEKQKRKSNLQGPLSGGKVQAPLTEEMGI